MINAKEFIVNFTDAKCCNTCTLKCGAYLYRGGKFTFKVKRETFLFTPSHYEWITGRVKAISVNYKGDNIVAVMIDGGIGMSLYDSDIVDVVEIV